MYHMYIYIYVYSPIIYTLHVILLPYISENTEYKDYPYTIRV